MSSFQLLLRQRDNNHNYNDFLLNILLSTLCVFVPAAAAAAAAAGAGPFVSELQLVKQQLVKGINQGC